ncbi:MAG: D-glycerate dehydrogenase [Candidatus Aminicenantes bacterium]
MRPKVLITQKLLPEATAYLKNHVDYETAAEEGFPRREDILSKIKDKQGLLCLLTDTIDKEIMDAAPKLKIIANCAVGYDNIDVKSALERGILVTNTPGVLTETTADLTWGLILSTARRIPEADRFTRQMKYQGWKLDLLLGMDLTEKRLGIIGMGRIGRAVALRAHPFKMHIVYHDPSRLTPKEETRFKSAYLPLDALLKTSDIITLHTALNPQTRHLISRRELELMKRDAILINVSRGPVVDEKALADALEEKRIRAAGLDVYEKEPVIEKKLLSLDNAVLVPHIGSATYETRLKMARMAAVNLVKGVTGKKPDHPVNWR